MGFEGLLGNERSKENLRHSIAGGHISHCYLLSGVKGSGRRTLAKLLAAAIVCQGADKPCLRCPACRKVMNNSHPDVITMDDLEKKTVSIELVRKACAEIYVRPNEADKKIYLFPRAQDMLPAAQNAFLKVLEEPPHYGVFVLITDNPENLLPTVRSRCTHLRLEALPADLLRHSLQTKFPDAEPDTIAAAIARSGGYLGQAIDLVQHGTAVCATAEQFVQGFAACDAMQLTQTLVSMEKYKRETLIQELSQWVELLENALLLRSGAQAMHPLAKPLAQKRTAKALMQAITELHKCIVYAKSNVSPAAICGYLVWALR